jgi:hypothetical protein
MQTKISLTKLLQEMRPGVLPMILKQSDRVLNGLVRHPLGLRTEIPKILHQDHVNNFFNSQSTVHNEFVPEGKKIKCRIL